MRPLSFLQLRGVLVVLGTEVGLLFRRQRVDERRIAEVEEGVGVHLRVVQHALVDFHGRDRVARLDAAKRVEMLFVGDVVMGRNPAVALAQEPNKERAAVLDFVQADVECLAPLGVFFRHAPAEVHIDQVKMPLGAPLAQLRKYDADQMVALRVHVAEGTTDEHADSFPGSRHRRLPLARQLGTHDSYNRYAPVLPEPPVSGQMVSEVLDTGSPKNGSSYDAPLFRLGGEEAKQAEVDDRSKVGKSPHHIGSISRPLACGGGARAAGWSELRTPHGAYKPWSIPTNKWPLPEIVGCAGRPPYFGQFSGKSWRPREVRHQHCPVKATTTIGISDARPPAEFLNFPVWRPPANATLWRKKSIQREQAHEAIRPQIRKNPRRRAKERFPRPAAVAQNPRAQERKLDIKRDRNFGAPSTAALDL